MKSQSMTILVTQADSHYEPSFTKDELMKYVLDLPALTRANLHNYVMNGTDPGGFLESVLTNNLQMTLFKADRSNLACLKDLVQYIFQYCPGNCHGSKECFDQWIKDKGLVGQLAVGNFHSYDPVVSDLIDC